MPRERWEQFRAAGTRKHGNHRASLARYALGAAELVDVSVPGCVEEWQRINRVVGDAIECKDDWPGVWRRCLEWLATAPLAALEVTDATG